MNKSLLSNLVAAAILIVAFLIDNALLKNIGLFALSGALTNWIAIHMLFERVPGLYGSGVIPNNFEALKVSLRDLLMRQFFTQENIQRLLGGAGSGGDGAIELEPVIERTDFDPVFDGFVSVIEESSFGSMLAMVGGVEALQPMREPFVKRMKSSLIKLTSTAEFQASLRSSLTSEAGGDAIYSKISAVIDQRLDELTPAMVKKLMQDLIAKHLGWLVVWGAVFGGLIGAVAALLP